MALPELRDYLTTRSQVVPPISAIRQARLEGWVHAKLPSKHPLKIDLRADVIARSAKHALIRQNLAGLIRAWNDVGIYPLLFKGFALAEFVYKAPSERFYGDVDLLLSLPDARRASQIARELGWLENINLDRETLGFDHEYSHLFSQDRSVRIDLHLEFLQTDRPSKKRERFAFTLLESAQLQSFLAVNVRLLKPVDHMIVLLLNRRWGDRWGRKASDYCDLLALIERYGITKTDLLERAKALGCVRNIQIIVQTCDPWCMKLELRKPSRLQQWAQDLQCSTELGSYEIDYFLERLRQAPSRIIFISLSLPLLLRANAARREIKDLHQLVASFDAPPSTVLFGVGYVSQWCLGIIWAARLLRLHNPCVPKSLALMYVLTRQGIAASFVSGVRRDETGIAGHAWLEVSGLPTEMMGDLQAPTQFKESFRYANRFVNREVQKP